jgi:uroporphyrinogen III methyltransferase/synthase
VDCVTFTSSSTVQNFVSMFGAETLRGIKMISIGPITTRTARDLGIDVAAEAQPFTVDGLLEAVLRLCQTELTPPDGATPPPSE